MVSKKLVIALNTFLLCISGSPVYAQQIQRDTGRPVDQKVIEKQLERKLADALTRGDVSEAARVQQQLQEQQSRQKASALVKILVEIDGVAPLQIELSLIHI